MSFLFQDQDHPIALTHRSFTSGPCLPTPELGPSHQLLLYLSPCCAQPLEPFLFAQSSLCADLGVCLECLISSPSFGESLLPFRTNSNVSSSKVFFDCFGQRKFIPLLRCCTKLCLGIKTLQSHYLGFNPLLYCLLLLCPWAPDGTSLCA